MKIVAVMGTFNETGGKSSGYAGKIWESVAGPLLAHEFGSTIDYYNGGDYQTLQLAFTKATSADVIIWWANVSNDAPISKLVGDIKSHNPRGLLVISKNNIEEKYGWIDLIGRQLAAHAALSLVVEKKEGLFCSTILDPLGNAYAYREFDVRKIGDALARRIITIRRYTRMRSIRIGPEQPIEHGIEVGEFCKTIQSHAETFHALVHSANPSRFVGNAAFRCTQGGFPAYRKDNRIFVSRRNIDKRDISPRGFVEVKTIFGGRVEYYGDNPPSVDSPVQYMLFDAFPTVNYMIHAHVYLDTPLWTKSNVPCGALEEFPEITLHQVAIENNLHQSGIALINLRGHGCLVLATGHKQLATLPWVGRPMPEIFQG